MTTLQSAERLAEHIGLRLVRDDDARCWLIQRGQKVIHRDHSLTDIEAFLSAWAKHVR